jgi:predicted naringenin-chalcone synthase
MAGLRIKNISSLLWPQFRDELRFKYHDARLCNVISPKVPEIVANAIHTLYKGFFCGKNCVMPFIRGKKVLDAIQSRLGLSDEDMRPSRQILKELRQYVFTIGFICLKEYFKRPVARPRPGDLFFFWCWFFGINASNRMAVEVVFYFLFRRSTP